MAKSRTDRWLSGYMCAVCQLIYLDGFVETNTFELFRSGAGNKTLQQLKEQGVDENDLSVLEQYWDSLHNK